MVVSNFIVPEKSGNFCQRGVYVVDRANTGLHIVELTPEGKKLAGVE